MDKKPKKKLSKADWAVRIVVTICVVLFIALAIFIVPRINSEQARSDTYSFLDFEYPAFHRVVKKQWLSIDMFASAKYRQYMYTGNYADEEIAAYVNYLEEDAGFTMFPVEKSRWHFEISAGKRDQNGDPRYINIVHYTENGAVFVTLW